MATEVLKPCRTESEPEAKALERAIVPAAKEIGAAGAGDGRPEVERSFEPQPEFRNANRTKVPINTPILFMS
jgi:hypothetical protein